MFQVWVQRAGRRGPPTGVRWCAGIGVLLAGFALVMAARADNDPVPSQPADPAAAKAYGVFDQACASCHQAGRLKTLKQPAGSLGNILDLEALARNPAWVIAGNADASPLYTAIQSRAMPVETPGEAVAEITATELGSVRDWIEQLPTVDRCADRARVTAQAVAATVAAAVKPLDAARALTTRFVSLAPLHNACATAAEMQAAAQAVALLVNMLSLGLEPVRLTAAGPGGAVLQFDLGAIGWDAERWDRLVIRSPAAPFTVFDAATRAATGTALPLVHGDWLVDAASRAPLYYDLLGLPETLPALMASLKIDPAEAKRGAVARIGLRSSAVARGNRLIERRVFGNGAAWSSLEFAPTAGRPDMFELMVAAANSGGGSGGAGAAARLQISPDVRLLHFDLPNGFPAYFMANASGARINEAPHSVLKDDSHPSARFAAAQSCIGCHAASPVTLARGRSDDLKARLIADTALAKEARERLLATHVEPAELQRQMDEDSARYRRAAAAAGIDPDARIEGLDPLSWLIARYRRAVDVHAFADLADLEPKALFELGKTGSAVASDVIGRAALGTIARADVEAVLAEIAARRGLSGLGPRAVPVSARPRPDSSALQLVLKAERAAFQPGDLLVLTARASAPCYLTVLSLNTKGRGTVLYPNEFEPTNVIEADREVRVPAENAGYQFRLRDKGQETLIGICSTTSKTVDSIAHDFEKQRFTELGDYRAFLNRSWGNRDGETKPARARTPAARGEVQARAAFRITIE